MGVQCQQKQTNNITYLRLTGPVVPVCIDILSPASVLPSSVSNSCDVPCKSLEHEQENFIFLKKLSHTTVIILVLSLSVHVVLSIKYTTTLSSEMEYMWNKKCREGTDWNKLKQINFKFTEQCNYQLKMIHKITHRECSSVISRGMMTFFTLQINAWTLTFIIWKHEQLRIFTTHDIWKFFQNYYTHLKISLKV